METTTSTLTSKGQITIPKNVRAKMGLKPGDEVEFVETDGVIALRRVFKPTGLLKYKGYLKNLAGTKTDDLIEEMRGR